MSVARMRGFVAALLIFGLLHSIAQAADIGLTLHRIDSSQFPTVRAYLSVVDSQGVPIERLTNEAFVLLEDDQPITEFQVESIVDSQESVAVALVIDVSGSMNDEGRLDGAKQAASAFVDTMGLRDTAAVMSFHDTVDIVQGYTSDKAALKGAIEKLETKGDTALYDAIFQAAQLQGALPQQRKVIVVLTDGEDTKSGKSIDESIAAVNGAGTLLITIGLGDGVKKETIDTLAGATGGRAIAVASTNELRDVFLQIGDQLRRQYVLTYTSSLPADDTSHNLSISVNDRGRTAEVKGPFTATRTTLAFDVTGLTNAAKVSGQQGIEVNITSGTATEVELLVDDQSRGKANAAPFTFQWDTTTEQPGIHRVVIRATDASGATTEKEFAVEVVGAAPATGVPTAVATTVAATPAATPAPSSPATTEETNPLIYVVAGLLALVLIGGGIGAFLFLRRRKLKLQIPQEEPAPAPVVSDRTEIVDLRAPAVVAPPVNVASTPSVSPPPPPPPPTPSAPQSEPEAHGTVVSEPAPQATIVGSGTEQATIVGGATVVPPRPRAILRIEHDGTRREVVIDQPETVMGRESSNPIVIKDPLASRRHAKIVIENGEFWIEDLKSLNGTRVNGEVITRRKLVNSDQIKIGDTILTFISDPG